VKVALFVGDHQDDAWSIRAGWWLTRKVQKGPYGEVTHVEAILQEHLDGSVTIASASVRDGGVRSKSAHLNALHWRIVDVPQWDTQASQALLAETGGRGYDWRGAIATVFLGSQNADQWFCNEWVGYPFIKASATFSPSQFAAICLSLGRDVTLEFFGARP
jgi:hypothetical protein